VISVIWEKCLPKKRGAIEGEYRGEEKRRAVNVEKVIGNNRVGGGVLKRERNPTVTGGNRGKKKGA